MSIGWVRQKTRLLNQIRVTLKEYYPLGPWRSFRIWNLRRRWIFLTQYPTPQALSELSRRKWNRFAKREHYLGEDRCQEFWEKLRSAATDSSPTCDPSQGAASFGIAGPA